MIERLPTPWGLVRLGVAPDHPNIKAVSRAFERTAAQPGFRFFGNVEVGKDVEHAELARLYDAVVYSVGAQTDRQLGIPGEDLPGSWPATAFVAWYNGHPDFQDLSFDLSGERAVVIGNGNVALDVARMLALTPEELAPTDTTDPAIEAIAGSGIREILVVGRRGPVQAAWTPVEVRRARRARGSRRDRRPGRPRAGRGQRSRARGGGADRAPQRRAPARLRRARAHRQAARDPAALLLLAGRDPRRRQGRGDRARPERARRTAARSPTEERETIPCGIVFRSVGYQGVALPGLPFDERLGDDPERRRPRRAGPLRRRLDQARPERRDRDEQEGRDRDGGAPARRRPRRPVARPRARARSRRCSRSAASRRSSTPAGRRSTRRSATPASRMGRPRVKLCSWDELLAAARAKA